MLASSGETTAPCGVPTFVSDHRPSSETPAFHHFWIRRSIRRSATRCSTNFIVHSWLMLSKETTTHSLSSAPAREGHRCSRFGFFQYIPHEHRGKQPQPRKKSEQHESKSDSEPRCVPFIS